MRSVHRRHAVVGVVFAVWLALGAASAQAGDPSDQWNPFDHKRNDVCVSLVNGSAPFRFEDFSEVGSNYIMRADSVHPSDGCTASRPVSIDAEEMLTIGTDVKHYLYFHKGDLQSHYGHIGRAEIPQSQWPVPLSDGPPSAGVGGAGKGCTPSADAIPYRIKIDATGEDDAIPENWQYKIHEPGARYYEYSSAGDRLGANNQARYGYLSWTWVIRHDWPSGAAPPDDPYQNPYLHPDEWGNERVTNDSGGVVRSLLKAGQTFYRCSVDAINGLAWAPDADGDSRIAGRVTAVYGKTRTSSDGPWLYGWAVYSHQVRTGTASSGEPLFGSRYYHMTAPTP